MYKWVRLGGKWGALSIPYLICGRSSDQAKTRAETASSLRQELDAACAHQHIRRHNHDRARREGSLSGTMHSSFVRVQNLFGFWTTVVTVLGCLIAASDLLHERSPSASVQSVGTQMCVDSFIIVEHLVLTTPVPSAARPTTSGKRNSRP